MKEKIIQELNQLNIQDMNTITELYEHRGEFVNLTFTLPSKQKVKFWVDDKVYFTNQLEKKNSERCYGIVADEQYLFVCEYGENGADPEIMVFKKWN